MLDCSPYREIWSISTRNFDSHLADVRFCGMNSHFGNRLVTDPSYPMGRSTRCQVEGVLKFFRYKILISTWIRTGRLVNPIK